MPAWMGATAGVVVIVAIWWIASLVLFQDSHAIPTPPSVIALFFDGSVWQSTWNNVSGTIASAGTGYLWGNLLAIVLAAVVMLIPPLEELVNQIAIVTYCLPTVAIGPIIIIVAGRDAPDAASVALAALGCFFTTVVGALLGLRAAPRTSLDVIRAYGGSKFTALRKVQLIAALPNLLNALKIAAPAAFLGAVLAEYLGSGGESSLGKALTAAQFNADAPRLWYLALISGAIAGIAYFVIGLIGRIITPWSSGQAAPGGA
ncbi:ABC transporter permease subunit [Nakamurella sp. YIM 132087]|uniref:ABC transporter permease subunit n=2 Tax=Nakamurella alba TaxID=2665158 RepID=A0A7K1FIT1_9ACTN|nr:ABC transporter permease subunit [Nakamurella alba]